MKSRYKHLIWPVLAGLALILGVACGEVVTGDDELDVSEAVDAVNSSCTASVTCSAGTATCSGNGSGATCTNAFFGGKQCTDSTGDVIVCCYSDGSAHTCNATDSACTAQCQN
jgi:hypothetical protein